MFTASQRREPDGRGWRSDVKEANDLFLAWS